jgi:hypothetical protein
MRFFVSSLIGIAFTTIAFGALSTGTVPRAVDVNSRLPVGFEVNQGQCNPEVKFFAHGTGHNFLLTADGLVVSPSSAHSTGGDRLDPLRLRLLGANPHAETTAQDRLAGTVNYFLGTDPRQWRVGVPRFARVRYGNVYPGIDLVYYSNQRQVECDFVAAPGADPNLIALTVDGAAGLLDAQGDVVFRTAAGELRLRHPAIYQETGHGQRPIAGGFVINARGQIRFQVAAYDAGRPLIIDPVLVFSTFLGGSFNDAGTAIGIDPSTNIIVAGYTDSSNFPTTNALQKAKDTLRDAFVVKVDATGTNLVYATYLGGNQDDVVNALAVDADGNVYLTGQTSSSDFPTTGGAFQTNLRGGTNAFVVALDPSGTNLIYATYLGGNRSDAGFGIAVDTNGDAFVTGQTSSDNYPTTFPAFQGALKGASDAFVTEVDPSGNNLVYSTYLGGGSNDAGQGIAVDISGNAYVTGQTLSSNFPTIGAIQGALDHNVSGGAGQDAFVTEILPGGEVLAYSTYLGGGGTDIGYGIAVDGSGAAYVTGFTSSSDFPRTKKPLQNSLDGGKSLSPVGDAFVTKISPGGSTFSYSTFLGGAQVDAGFAIAVNASNEAYVAGTTLSGSFPNVNAIQTSCRSCSSGLRDAFVAKLAASGQSLVYSTFLGGSGDDASLAVALDAKGDAYLTGFTGSINFPRAHPLQLQINGASDAFITEIGERTVHDLAVTSIKAPKTITLTATKSISTNFIAVEIQNRSSHSETISNLTVLANLVSLTVQSTGACPNPTPVLVAGKPQRSLPVTLKSKAKLKVQFRVIFDCVNDPAKTAKQANHSDYSYLASVDHSALDGNSDDHAEDDVCPRSVTPPFEIDPFPDGTIKDKGCGSKATGGTLGGDVVTDLVVKP